MKDYKMMLAAAALGLSVLIIGLFTVSVFNYIAFLKEQNYTLLENINSSIAQLKSSVVALQSQSRVREITELKNENVSLKKEAEMLRRRAYSGRALQEPAAAEEKKKSGNRGYLLGGE